MPESAGTTTTLGVTFLGGESFCRRAARGELRPGLTRRRRLRHVVRQPTTVTRPLLPRETRISRFCSSASPSSYLTPFTCVRLQPILLLSAAESRTICGHLRGAFGVHC